MDTLPLQDSEEDLIEFATQTLFFQTSFLMMEICSIFREHQSLQHRKSASSDNHTLRSKDLDICELRTRVLKNTNLHHKKNTKNQNQGPLLKNLSSAHERTDSINMIEEALAKYMAEGETTIYFWHLNSTSRGRN